MRRQSGYTLVELMVVVCIIGVLAVVAIPAFMGYIKKSKTAEARELVRKIYEGARVYYQDPVVNTAGMGGPVPAMFPEPSLAATPALGTCCASGGKCNASADYWKNPTWVALAFAVPDPHYYHYAYTVSGNGADGATYYALAYGDLDCDGVYSTFRAIGQANSIYSDGPAGSGAVGVTNPLE